MTVVRVPATSLVVLVGVTGSGKSTFAARHFRATEVLSSDFCRGLLADDENDQAVTPEAFALLEHIAGLRLEADRLTVVDATNVQPQDRRRFVQLARDHDVLPVAIVLDVPEAVAVERTLARPDRAFGREVVHRQHDRLRRSLRGLSREGFRGVHVLRGVDEIESATLERTRLFNDRRDLTGPFDVIGDVHGCLPELLSLLDRLGYAIERDADGRAVGAHRDDRTAVFVGDLVDRGPDVTGVLRLVMGMVAAGDALCVTGNHEDKLLRHLRGRPVQVSHGLDVTLAQLAREDDAFRAEVIAFLDGLVAHLVLDGGRLVVAHAGLPERLQGRASRRARDFALYGQTNGETDEYGLPVRLPWADDYRGSATVVHGHTPVVEPEWVNGTLCVDTGCVFGGRLTALRHPERTLESVPAEREYAPPVRPLERPARTEAAPVRDPGVLEIGDVQGARVVETRFDRRIGVREEQAAAALEVMSRYAVDPRWLVHLPPTMSPVATAAEGDLLEHPDQAFDAYRSDGVREVVCEQKHMGSRAIALVCRDLGVARARFGAPGGRLGSVWTRTGRPFFDDGTTAELVDRMRIALEAAGLFDELGGTIVLDAELLPWNAKAGDLIRDVYASVGAAARAALPPAVDALAAAASRGLDVGPLLERTRRREADATAFTAAYRRYVAPTAGLDGVRLAPFQVLAAGSEVLVDRPHLWHLSVADRLAAAAPALFQRTDRLVVDVDDAGSREAGAAWWTALTDAGGEGMVVKPAAGLPLPVGGRAVKLPQPGLKVRGPEYLRLIYGPEYRAPANLVRLRQRSLGHKRSLAMRETTLGLEALLRWTAGEPLHRVHECVFAVLALESEPVDPRL